MKTYIHGKKKANPIEVIFRLKAQIYYLQNKNKVGKPRVATAGILIEQQNLSKVFFCEFIYL